jgi:hypothetical protein
MLRDFGARLCDIDAIYRRTLAQERAQVQPEWWKRLWHTFWRRHTSDAARAMNYMATLDEPQVIDIASFALGGTLAAHRQFRERHGLKHAAAADAHNSAAPAAAVRECCSPSSNLPQNSASATDNEQGSDLQMNISFSPLQISTENPAQARITSGHVPAHSSSPVIKPKSSKHPLGRSRNAPPSQTVSVELQEVVVHGCDAAAGTQQTAASQPRGAIARRGPAEESAVSASTIASSSDIRAVKTNKIIRALAPERKGYSDATPSVKSTRVEAVGAEDVATMGGRGLSQDVATMGGLGLGLSQDCPSTKDDPLLIPSLIARGSDGDVKQPSVPPPPPRSRSSSRIRASHGGNTTVTLENDAVGEQLSLSPIDVARAPTHASAFSPQPLRLTLSVSQHRPADSPPSSRNQASIVNISPSVTRRGEKAAAAAPEEPSFLNSDAAVRRTQGGALPRLGPCDVGDQRPAEPPRSRSHSRVRAEAASSRDAADSACVLSPMQPGSRRAPVAPAASISALSSARIAASHPPSDAAKQETKAAAAAERSSKKQLSGRQAAKLWDQKVKAMKEQFGDSFEEC